jgi:hypothetical protein
VMLNSGDIGVEEGEGDAKRHPDYATIQDAQHSEGKVPAV